MFLKWLNCDVKNLLSIFNKIMRANNVIKINNDIIKLPYSNMAIAQNYLAAYSISSTLGIKELNGFKSRMIFTNNITSSILIASSEFKSPS